MKSAMIHGVLLAVMLVYGYRTWTRDKSVKPDLGSVVLWSKTEAELASIEFKSEKKTVRLERKTDGKEGYWWGTETSVEKKPKPKPPEQKPADPTGGSGSAGSGSATGSGSAAKTGSGSGSAVATGSGSAKAGSGSAIATGSGSAKAGSGSAVAVGSGSAKAGSGSGSAVAVGSGSGSGSGSAVATGSGSAGSGSGSAAVPPPPVEMVETVKKREFPLGEGGDKVIKAFSDARAVGDLGKPSPDQLVDYKLANKDQVEAKLAEVKKELEKVKAEEAADKEKEKDEAKDKDPKDPKDKKKPPKKADKKPDLTKKIKDLEDQKKTAEKPRTTLTITFSDGSSRAFMVGGSIFGGTDRYVLDQQSGNAYVLSKDMVASLEVGESSLHLTDPRGFDVAKIEQVEVDWAGRKKVAKRVEAAGADGKNVKTWHDTETGKPNQPLATFVDNVNNLRPTEYAKDLKVDTMAPVFRLEYKEAGGGKLGSLSLYKIEKAPVIPDGGDFDPANPPKGEIEYYVVTERTRVPALVRKDPAQKSEEDLPIVFGDKAAPAPAPTVPKPPGPGSNPFGNVPTVRPKGGSGAPRDPHKP